MYSLRLVRIRLDLIIGITYLELPKIVPPICCKPITVCVISYQTAVFTKESIAEQRFERNDDREEINVV